MIFDRLFDWLLQLEGGFVDHPDDPGGKTKYGITEAVAARFGLKVEEITLDDARRIYHRAYYTGSGIDKLPPPWQAAVFLTGVLVGPSQAIKRMQQTVGLAPDGVIGPATIAAARKHVDKIPEFLILNLDAFRRLKHWNTFGRGWTNRMIKTAFFAGRMKDEA